MSTVSVQGRVKGSGMQLSLRLRYVRIIEILPVYMVFLLITVAH